MPPTSRVLSSLRLSVPLLLLSAALLIALSSPLVCADDPPNALVPVELVARGFHGLRGLAFGPDLALYASDQDVGVIYRLTPTGSGSVSIAVRQAGLRQPAGLAWSPDGLLVVAEEGGEQVLRLNGTPMPIWTGLAHPTWPAIAPDGSLYLTAQRWAGAGPGSKGGEPEDGFRLFRLRPGAAPEVLLSGLHQPGGLWLEPAGTLLFSVEKLSGKSEAASATLLRYDPSLPAALAPFITPLLGPGLKRPVGPAHDSLEALLLGAESYRPESAPEFPSEAEHKTDKGVLLRLRPGESPVILGSGFKEIRSLAWDPHGYLYVATDENIYRLRSPAAPEIDRPPQFTNLSPLSLRGTAASDSKITVLGGESPAATPVDPRTGTFQLSVPLPANAESQLRIYATNAGGLGLPSAPAEATVLHDNRAPAVHVTLPSPASFIRGSVEVGGEATETMLEGEAWSGIATLTLQQGESPLTTTPNGAPDSPLPHRTSAVWHTAVVPDGPHVLTATAADRAGNAASESITVTVDNTPPAVSLSTPGITGTASGVVAVTVAGSDDTSGLELLTFLVDGIVRQASSASPLTFLLDTRVLAAGQHLFTATASDRAGNTATVSRSITVQNLLVRITEPSQGATVASGQVLVRGTVEAAGAEVGIVINGVPAAVVGTTFSALVPVTPDTTSLTAVATLISGDSATSSLSLTIAAAPTPPVLLDAFPVGGASPLRVTFSVQNNTGRPRVSFELDFDGDGVADFTSAAFTEPQTTYSSQGLFLARLRATDDQGQVYSASTLVSVGGIPALEPKWEGLKAALRLADISGALTFIHSASRQRYEAVFRRLTPEQLTMIDRSLTTITPVEIGPNGAEYAMRRERGGELLSFPVWFQVDADGIWRLRSF